MTFKNDGGPSALQRIPALCLEDGLPATPDVEAAQLLINDALMAFDLTYDGAALIVLHKKLCEASKSRFKASLKSSECKRLHAQQRVQEL